MSVYMRIILSYDERIVPLRSDILYLCHAACFISHHLEILVHGYHYLFSADIQFHDAMNFIYQPPYYLCG